MLFRSSLNTLPALLGSLLCGAALSEVFSSGGFYFFSGRFTDTSFAEFGTRLVKYFPHQLQSFAFWMAIAVVVHVALTLSQSGKQHQA